MLGERALGPRNEERIQYSKCKGMLAQAFMLALLRLVLYREKASLNSLAIGLGVRSCCLHPQRTSSGMRDLP
jgi:hypothetical protein